MSFSAVVSIALAGLAIAASVIGTPLPFMKNGDQCETPYGYMASCEQSGYTTTTPNLPICSAAISRLKAVSAFQIIGIVGSGVAIGALILGLACRKPFFKWLAILGGLVGAISFLIVVGIEGSFYRQDICNTGSTYYDQGWTLTEGFALVVIAWVLDMFAPVVLCIFDPGFAVDTSNPS
jgi:hypothetical protein